VSLILITEGVIVIWRNNARSVLLRPTTTAEQCNEALKLALQSRGGARRQAIRSANLAHALALCADVDRDGESFPDPDDAA
jgi:hypothetical protein